MSFLKNVLPLLAVFTGITLNAGILPFPGDMIIPANEKSPFDMGSLKPGNFSVGKLNFMLSPAKDSQRCGMLFFTRGMKKNVRIELPVPAADDCFYLLHATAGTGGKKVQVGKVTLFFSNGPNQQQKIYPIRSGVEISDFFSPRNGKKSTRVLSLYNGVTQISLFATRLACPGKVTAVEFSAGDAPWCIAGAAFGPKMDLPAICPQMRVTRKFQPVQPVPAEVLKKLSANEKTPVKNIIFIIGDGMGSGARELTSRQVYGQPSALPSDQLPVKRFMTTFSANSKVTDSAASGTALAGGYKTNNGMLGMNPEKRKFHSIAAAAARAGYSVGIVTTDLITGATPAAFYAHVPRRKMFLEIVDDLLKCPCEVMAGAAGGEAFFLADRRQDKKDVKALLKKQNVYCVNSLAEMAKLPAKNRVLGFIRWNSPEMVGEALDITLGRLSGNSKGFFVMIECSWPDAGGHGNNPNRSVQGVLGTESAVVCALKFAAGHPGTLVVVTADHETGGIQVIPAAGPKPVLVKYHTTSHTGAPVPFFAAGSGCRAFPEKLDNSDLPKIMGKLLNLELPKKAQ